MTIAWSGSQLEAIIYLLCVATSVLCAYLLARAYRRLAPLREIVNGGPV